MLLEDQTRLGDILKCNLLLKLIQILIVLASTSFFFAMTFRFIMQIESDYMNWDQYNFNHGVHDGSAPEHFLSYYVFCERTDYEQTLALVYFSFTTLTTVGFGDYNPRSDGERFFIAFGLLFGVMIFAVILGNYQSILDEMKKFHLTADDSGELSRFFTILSRYNDYK
jgi:hypothetical protein